LEAYPGELIGVMVPLNRDLDEVVERLEESDVGEFCQFQSARQGYARLDPERRVVVTTVHGAKGLEFRCGHLIAADGLNHHRATRRRNLGFTAVTRAKTSLSVYRDNPAPGWLESAVHAAQRVNRAEREIQIEQLF
jgi:superfamily I DNA and RNA helicase